MNNRPQNHAPHHSNFWRWQGSEYRFDVFLTADFTRLRNVRQVYGVVLNPSRTHMLVVREKNGLWLLPGGTVEPPETLLQTLAREVKEETNRDVDLHTARPFFYQQTFHKNADGEWVYRHTQVRYIITAANDLEFVADPDHGIVEARWIPFTELGQYLDWGETTQMIVDYLRNPDAD